MKYIFFFTLSPVQSFIAQARKTQDLYAGSRILSELAKVAALAAVKDERIKLVFPQNTEGGNSFSNRFIGITEIDDETKLQTIGQDVEDTVIAKFKEFATNALDKVKISTFDDFDEQINKHLDINWLFQPIDTEGGYQEAYKAGGALLASLKNTRFITNSINPEAGRKCSLDGERNALFRGQNTTNNQLKNQAKEIDGNEIGIWLKPNEGLSAVSLLKRTYREENKKEFSSTVEVALSHQIKQLKKDKDTENFYQCYEQLFSEDYRKACSNLVLKEYWHKLIAEDPNPNDDWAKEFDHEFLFEENLTEQKITNSIQLSIARAIQKRLKSALTDKYYAIIAFDGDKMGQLLSGETRKDKTSNSAEFQGKVSTLLMKFSKWIYDTLDKKQIDVVYTGGDDFLGFVNLHNLFEVVKTLRLEFDKQVNQALKDDLEDDKPFTFSMGIAIAHYKTPLSIVLQTARDMEKLAKKKENGGDRDAFAIATLKHSGENHQAYFKWYLENEQLPKWNALQKLVDYFKNDCSETFLRSLDRELYYLQNGKGYIQNIEKPVKYIDKKTNKEAEKQMFMIETELFRLVTKSLEDNKKYKAKEVTDTVCKFFSHDETHGTQVENGLEAVKISLFIKRQTRKEKSQNDGN
ncbi:MAG: type III-B CRISPR-associated protein Cas10/Cmr2 [Saprospiraceae bacterium]|nr:type III-B CRISPR-associated protein Cas10/Cmr2 [Saprospiraceae bacterium]